MVVAGEGGHFCAGGDIRYMYDNYLAGREMTEHLLLQGHRHIAFLGHASERYPEFFERYRGYAEALVQAWCSD